MRTWAEGRREGFDRLGQVLRRFRGHPNRVNGYGIVLAPDDDRFPGFPPDKKGKPSQSLRVA